MARTPTTQIPLGFRAPDFLLKDTVSGEIMSFSDIKGAAATVVMFICNHCPYVIHVKDGLVRIAHDYSHRGVGFVAISSNDAVQYPMDGPEEMKRTAASWGLPFPYLYDESQDVARAYDAACTPDFSVFNNQDRCVYRGELDGSRPGNELPLNGESLREVLDLLVAGKTVPEAGQRPSIGCNIKWKQDEV